MLVGGEKKRKRASRKENKTSNLEDQPKDPSFNSVQSPYTPTPTNKTTEGSTKGSLKK